jgi:hypothetical protein
MDPAPTPAEGLQRADLLARLKESVPPITDADTGRVRMGYRTLFALIGICAVAFGAFLTVRFTADGAAAKIASHESDDYPHVAQFNKVTTLAEEAKTEAKSAKEASGRTEQQVRYIHGKIDFLIQNEIEQARSTPRGYQRARRAAESVRKRAGASRGSDDDPLKGLEGL